MADGTGLRTTGIVTGLALLLLLLFQPYNGSNQSIIENTVQYSTDEEASTGDDNSDDITDDRLILGEPSDTGPSNGNGDEEIKDIDDEIDDGTGARSGSGSDDGSNGSGSGSGSGSGLGSGDGDLPDGGFMVVPEYMAGALLMVLTFIAVSAVYMLRLRPKMQ